VNTETQLVGVIDRVIYSSPENGFSVFALKVSGAHEPVTVCGALGTLHQGTQVTLKGTWGFHPKFGRQFQATDCCTQLPVSASGIEKYLSSGLIKGIGPKFAQKLVAAFGDQTLEVIDKDPQRLLRVEGVGYKRVEAIVAAWNDQKEISRVMLFLRSKDVSPAYAVKIFKAYGNQAVEKMQDNPYCLVDDIWGIGFKTADQIALKMGLERNSMARVKAGILYGCGQATERGSAYVEVTELKKLVLEILELEQGPDQDLLKIALTELYQNNKVKLLTHDQKHYLALPQYYFSEKGIAQKCERLLEFRGRLQELSMDSLYKDLCESPAGVSLNEDQQRGVLSCFQNKMAIITGGPGTGKTTLVKTLIHLLDKNHVKFRLAAPTGRASKRLFESTGKSAETLHRLLEFTPGGVGFARNEHNALDLDVLIVDEASMIDIFLMHSVVRALPLTATLVLIGDVDQLPSVGAGNVLNDLIASEKIPVVRLTHIFRQAQNSMIVVNAHRVNKGMFPEPIMPGAQKDFVYVKEETPENIFIWLRTFYTQKLPKLGIPSDQTIVLVPMNRGVVGTQRLNQELQQIINPVTDPDKQITQFGTVYSVGDRVMQIRNNYDKFVFNGDIGTIQGIDRTEQQLLIAFGERELVYEFAELNELTLAYAISIHKSQGSEFSVVIIPIFMQHFILLQRNLIYTAITRAKKLCVLIGQPKAVAMGIKNAKGVERVTFLKQYLTTNLEAR